MSRVTYHQTHAGKTATQVLANATIARMRAGISAVVVES